MIGTARFDLFGFRAVILAKVEVSVGRDGGGYRDGVGKGGA